MNNTNTGAGGSQEALLAGFHATFLVSVGAALLETSAMVTGRRRAAIEELPNFEDALEEGS